MTKAMTGTRARKVLLAILDIATDNQNVHFDTAALISGEDDIAAIEQLKVAAQGDGLIWRLATLAVAEEYDTADELIAVYRANKIKALRSG